MWPPIVWMASLGGLIFGYFVWCVTRAVIKTESLLFTGAAQSCEPMPCRTLSKVAGVSPGHASRPGSLLQLFTRHARPRAVMALTCHAEASMADAEAYAPFRRVRLPGPGESWPE